VALYHSGGVNTKGPSRGIIPTTLVGIGGESFAFVHPG
jgi:hypothetical protein